IGNAFLLRPHSTYGGWLPLLPDGFACGRNERYAAGSQSAGGRSCHPESASGVPARRYLDGHGAWHALWRAICARHDLWPFSDHAFNGRVVCDVRSPFSLAVCRCLSPCSKHAYSGPPLRGQERSTSLVHALTEVCPRG